MSQPKSVSSDEVQTANNGDTAGRVTSSHQQDQHEIILPLKVDMLGYQTDNIQLTTPYTSTTGSTNIQSQTVGVSTADQRTDSGTPHMVSQGVLTDASITSTATNQTDPYLSRDQFTETYYLPVESLSDVSTKFTNTPISSTACCQTDFDFTDDMIDRNYQGTSLVDPFANRSEAYQTESFMIPNDGLEIGGVLRSRQDVGSNHLDEGTGLKAHAQAKVIGDKLTAPMGEAEANKALNGDGIPLLASFHPIDVDTDKYFQDKKPDLTHHPIDEELSWHSQNTLDEPFAGEEDETVELAELDLDPPSDGKIVDLDASAVGYEKVLQERLVGQQRTEDVNTSKEKPAERNINRKATIIARKRRPSSRPLKQIIVVMAVIIFLLSLVFIFQPRCCENTRYYKGIFGLRKAYSGLPLH